MNPIRLKKTCFLLPRSQLVPQAVNGDKAWWNRKLRNPVCMLQSSCKRPPEAADAGLAYVEAESRAFIRRVFPRLGPAEPSPQSGWIAVQRPSDPQTHARRVPPSWPPTPAAPAQPANDELERDPKLSVSPLSQ
ncbi:hypothetical protein PTTG_28723 [Puccinia triticina 1-1 BBBD Race 1]|uniref:Uncharacterized protein n=1 Tax=Puccinia triticina (isolate 1-1 / race 1 (BBBD)) TaxID=630390 RepID=A0A180GA39_PUCT1|nr:hypothetical protein PTTG_28723 [Puccinia triticina 1-1 BBBD Race 1]